MKKRNTLIIKENNGTIIFQGTISELPLREDYIIATSIALYRETEPCIIYRTHIMKKFYLLLYEKLCDVMETEMACSRLDEYFRCIDLDTQNAKVCFAR